MIERLIPRQADNAYQGHRLALWILALIILMKLGIGLNSVFNGHYVASFADGIPIDTYTPAGTQTVLALFAVLGLFQLMLGLLGMLVLGRYRALVPLMFSLLLLDQLGRKLILLFIPIERTGAPSGSVVYFALLAAVIVGLALSLRRPARDSRI